MSKRTPLLALLVPLLLLAACDKATPVAPTGTTITLSVTPTRIEAKGTADVTAIVRKEDGTPVNPGTEVNFTTTLGSIEAVAPTDERGVAIATLRGDGRVGTATVTASSGAAAAVTVDVQVGSLGASITLTATPTDLPKEGGTVELLALVRDDTGAPLADTIVNFSSELGSLDSQGAAVRTNEDGEARDTLSVTRENLSVLSDSFFEVLAQTSGAGGGLLEDIVEIQVRGFASTISLSATPSGVPEAGGTSTLRALVRDSLGDPLEGASVNFTTELGNLLSGGGVVPTGPSGQAEDTLTVARVDIEAFSGNNFTVRAQVGGVGGTLLEDSVAIQITSSAPVASFTYSGPSGSLKVNFEFTGSGVEPLVFEWDFDEDGFSDSSLRDPTYTWTTPGGKKITLKVSNQFGDDEASTQITVPLP